MKYTHPNGQNKSPDNRCCVVKRISIILFLSGIVFNTYAHPHLQMRIDLKYKDIPIKEIFAEIEKRSDYIFLFSGNPGDEINRKIDVDISSDSIEEILETVIENTSLGYWVLDRQIVIFNKAHGPKTESTEKIREIYVRQTIKKLFISGKVTDEKAEPIAGVNVAVPGTTIGTVTGKEGKFALNVPKGSVLRFSCIGYIPSEVIVSEQKTLNIRLKEKKQALEEVVVTGIVSRKAENYTGATQSYSKEQLRNIGNQNLFQSLKNLDAAMVVLENLEAGSNPNSLPELQLRGTSTFTRFSESKINNLKGNYQNKPNLPLFILDGFETPLEKVMDMDINRIERIDILKDAASKAIYGSQAANGVIVIETNRHIEKGVRISYNGGLSLEIPDLSSYRLCDAKEKLQVELLEGVYDLDHPKDAEIYYKRKKIIQEGVNTYWLAKPLRTGTGNKHSISIELGENKLRSIVNFFYNKINGAMKGSERNTVSGYINLSYRTSGILFRNIASIDQTRTKDSPYGTFSDYVKINPYSEVYDSEGNINKYYDTPHGSGDNPLHDARMNIKKEGSYINFNNNFYAEWNIFPELKATLRIGINSKKNEYDEYYPWDHSKFNELGNSERHRRGSYRKNNGSQIILSGDFFINFSKTINRHTFFANVRTNIGQNKGKETIIEIEGFPNKNMNDIAHGMQYRQNSKPEGIDFIRNELGISGLFSYVYDNRFLSDLTIRTNASSMFGNKSRWARFWSIGIGYNLHNEYFLKDIESVNYLKLRSSIGYTGNQNFASNKAIGLYSYIMNKYYTPYWSGAKLQNLENPDLKWEQKLDYDIGVDFNIFNIDVKFDYYIAVTKHLVTDIDIVTSTGFSSVAENIGQVENKGIELNTRYVFWQRENNFLAGNFSISTNKNKIIRLSEPMRHFNEMQDKLASQMQTHKPIPKYIDGRSMNEIWAVPSLGIDPANGRELFIDRDGNTTYIWDAANMLPCGSSQPKYRGIFGISGEYKGLGINANFRFIGGGYKYNQTLVDKIENADISYNLDNRVLSGRWKEPGQQSLFKKIGRESVYNYDLGKYETLMTRVSTRFVQKQNELIFGNLTVYYNFNHKHIKRYGFSRLKLSFHMNDIATFSTIGIERGTTYPFARNFSFSLTTTL